MGMFDTIYLHHSLLPITKEQVKIADGFQTKDLNRVLAVYEVGKNKAIKLTHRCDYIDPIPTNPIDINGTVILFGFLDKDWKESAEFEAEFESGVLKSIKRIYIHEESMKRINKISKQ